MNKIVSIEVRGAEGKFGIVSKSFVFTNRLRGNERVGLENAQRWCSMLHWLGQQMNPVKKKEGKK